MLKDINYKIEALIKITFCFDPASKSILKMNKVYETKLKKISFISVYKLVDQYNINKVDDNDFEKLFSELLKLEGISDIIIKPFYNELRSLSCKSLKLCNESMKLSKTINMACKVIQSFNVLFFKENILYCLVILVKQKKSLNLFVLYCIKICLYYYIPLILLCNMKVIISILDCLVVIAYQILKMLVIKQ